MEENSIQCNENTYLLGMSSEDNKTKTNEKASNVTIEYGENDLKEILLAEIKEAYIKKNSNIPS